MAASQPFFKRFWLECSYRVPFCKADEGLVFNLMIRAPRHVKWPNNDAWTGCGGHESEKGPGSSIKCQTCLFCLQSSLVYFLLKTYETSSRFFTLFIYSTYLPRSLGSSKFTGLQLRFNAVCRWSQVTPMGELCVQACAALNRRDFTGASHCEGLSGHEPCFF